MARDFQYPDDGRNRLNTAHHDIVRPILVVAVGDRDIRLHEK
jgi:hypothetical protein